MELENEAERAANEAVFREANERIREAEARIEPPLDSAPYLCECDDVRCRELIPLSREEYERIRDEATLFAVLPGHSTQGEVVDDRGAYLVVRKTGVAAEVARARDPRGRG